MGHSRLQRLNTAFQMCFDENKHSRAMIFFYQASLIPEESTMNFMDV